MFSLNAAAYVTAENIEDRQNVLIYLNMFTFFGVCGEGGG